MTTSMVWATQSTSSTVFDISELSVIAKCTHWLFHITWSRAIFIHLKYMADNQSDRNPSRGTATSMFVLGAVKGHAVTAATENSSGVSSGFLNISL